MTIRSRTATLDDVSGELALTLAKLEMEAAHGTANAEEQVDFVRDLSRAALEKEVRPWRSRAVRALVFGLACLAGALALPAAQPSVAGRGIPALFGLAALCLVAAGVFFGVFLQRRRREQHWLREKEVAIAAGRTILEER